MGKNTREAPAKAKKAAPKAADTAGHGRVTRAAAKKAPAKAAADTAGHVHKVVRGAAAAKATSKIR